MYPAQRPVEGPAAQEQSPPPLLSSPRQLLAGILQCRCCGRGGRRGIGQRRAQRVARVQRSPAECATALMPVAPQPLNACCCCARQAGASWGSAALWLLLGCLLTAACWAAGAVALRTHRRRHSAVQVWSSVLLSCSALLSLSPRPAECSAVSQSCRRCSANNVPLSCQLHVHPHVMARTASHGSLQGDLPLRPSAAVQTRSTRPLRLEGFCPPPPCVQAAAEASWDEPALQALLQDNLPAWVSRPACAQRLRPWSPFQRDPPLCCAARAAWDRRACGRT